MRKARPENYDLVSEGGFRSTDRRLLDNSDPQGIEFTHNGKIQQALLPGGVHSRNERKRFAPLLRGVGSRIDPLVSTADVEIKPRIGNTGCIVRGAFTTIGRMNIQTRRIGAKSNGQTRREAYLLVFHGRESLVAGRIDSMGRMLRRQRLPRNRQVRRLDKTHLRGDGKKGCKGNKQRNGSFHYFRICRYSTTRQGAEP